ncbi:Uncharacterised protein [Zhongshania aliphaticivorans]|nr:Uncharacterised protein [Zhongshania aliphaticivorans]
MNAHSISHHFSVNPKKIRLIAAAMGFYILLILWPAFDLCRLIYANDPHAFSAQRAITAAIVATAFSLYANWQMGRLCLYSHNT